MVVIPECKIISDCYVYIMLYCSHLFISLFIYACIYLFYSALKDTSFIIVFSASCDGGELGINFNNGCSKGEMLLTAQVSMPPISHFVITIVYVVGGLKGVTVILLVGARSASIAHLPPNCSFLVGHVGSRGEEGGRSKVRSSRFPTAVLVVYRTPDTTEAVTLDCAACFYQGLRMVGRQYTCWVRMTGGRGRK